MFLALVRSRAGDFSFYTKHEREYNIKMTIEVDQSIKIEQTKQDTAIGVSNGKQYSVLISRHIKRKLEIDFRKAGIRHLFAFRTFVAGVVLAIEYMNISHLSDVVIDVEYPGKDRMVKSIFLEMWSRRHDLVPDVRFHLIGKKSKAHEACYLVTRGIRKPDKVLGYGELKKLAISRTKQKPG